jgi:probable F420-dependent oxidoreductase
VMDRLLAPLHPRSAYPGTPDGHLPAEHHCVLDPLVTLTHAAAVTHRVRLGTNVLVAPWYPPVSLARSLTTIDLLSRGRLTVGLGIGWSTDEYEATGASITARGARLEETLDVLQRVWTDDIVEYDGSTARIAACTVEPKPHQRPHPPVLLAAFSPAGFDRIARRADGWLPVGMPAAMIGAIWAGIRHAAEGLGRNPDDLQLVVRANVKVAPTTHDGSRAPFTGTIAQIAGDVGAIADAGANELILDVQADARTGEEVIELADRIVGTAGIQEGRHVLATAAAR